MASPVSAQKETIRERIWQKMLEAGLSARPHGRIPPFKGREQAAQKLRQLAEYIQARKIMVPPDEALYHARLNILQDGKELIMATPGIRDGFYRLDSALSPVLRSRGVTLSGIRSYGKKLETSFRAIGMIDLLVTGAVAVSISNGTRIGKGTGYFDLEYAILAEIGCVDQETPIVTVVHAVQIYEALPSEHKDVSTDYIVTPDAIIRVENPGHRPSGLEWKHIDGRLISRLRPLRELKRGMPD